MGMPNAERLTALLGLLAVMLATLPGYLDGGHETRLALILMAAAVVAVVSLFNWRMLDAPARRSLPRLLGRLGICLLIGPMAMMAWYALTAGGAPWQVSISHGATAGLLVHVVSLWWKRDAAA